ncbi:MAG: I78 family peptidase inhibitor, partial [Pseudomonadota bacterium]|nr:I78 family peptidase inhibitor [Pseudomonadota bacterium]
MKTGLALAALLLMGCTTMAPEEDVPVHGDTGYRCDAARVADLVGRPATAELGAEALRRSGARSLRWIRPGDVVTMEYRPDRLNIH